MSFTAIMDGILYCTSLFRFKVLHIIMIHYVNKISEADVPEDWPYEVEAMHDVKYSNNNKKESRRCEGKKPCRLVSTDEKMDWHDRIDKSTLFVFKLYCGQ